MKTICAHVWWISSNFIGRGVWSCEPMAAANGNFLLQRLGLFSEWPTHMEVEQQNYRRIQNFGPDFQNRKFGPDFRSQKFHPSEVKNWWIQNFCPDLQKTRRSTWWSEKVMNWSWISVQTSKTRSSTWSEKGYWWIQNFSPDFQDLRFQGP